MSLPTAKIRAEIKKLKTKILEINSDIFYHPELNFKEVYSSNLLSKELADEGFAIKRGKGKLKTAFEATFRGSKKAPTIAILAEYDALPHMGHACGHNMIAAAAYGAAVAIKRTLGSSCGTLKVLGCPAEEGGGGKIFMIREGWFKGVDCAMMIHPANKTRSIARMLAVMEVEFIYKGKASHAAAHPELGINALDGVIALFNNVNAMRQQTPNFSRVHGIVTNGGVAPNIIPEEASALFMVRGLTMPDFKIMEKKLMQAAKGAATATGTKLKIKRNPVIFEPLEPNRVMANIYAKHMSAAGLKDAGLKETEEIGSSDIGNVSQILPTIHPEFDLADKQAINHSRPFLECVLSEKGTTQMLKATEAMAATVTELFLTKTAIKKAKEEWQKFKANQ